MLGPIREDEASRKARKRAAPAIGFGSSFAGAMALFGLGGHWLDRKTGHESLFTLIGIGLGFLFGAWELWKLIVLSNQVADDKDPNQAGGKEVSPNEPSE